MERSADPASQGLVEANARPVGQGPVCPTGAALGRFQPLGLGEVVLAEGADLGDWQRRNSEKTLPHCVEQVRASGAVRNLERLAEGQPGGAAHEGMHFSDSDVYKVLEAAAWDSAGRSALFAVTSRVVEHLLQTFSLNDDDDRLVGVCGHPEVETALVEFYRLTGDARALELAKRQVYLRGRAEVASPASGLLGGSRFPLSYVMHHAPERERTFATGHAVRELYLQAGVVDVAVEVQDEELLAASERNWEDLFSTKTYLTGCHGSRHRDEAIGDAYELPSDRAFIETCAWIASFQWNWRLLLATGKARYAEAMEQVLWNTIAGAISRQGTEFFYSNTLHLRTGHGGQDEDTPSQRLPWYRCTCCPPNLARLIASIQAYLSTRNASGLQVQMPFSGTVSTGVPGGAVELVVRAGHPCDGTTGIEVERCSPMDRWDLSLRSPEWGSREVTSVTVNGHTADVSWDGSYLSVARRWSSGDSLKMSKAVPVRVLRPHRRLDAVRDCAAVQRGPLVYCVGAADLGGGAAVEDVVLDASRSLEPSQEAPGDLKGYVRSVIVAAGELVDTEAGPLYNDEARGAEHSAVGPHLHTVLRTGQPVRARDACLGPGLTARGPNPGGRTTSTRREEISPSRFGRGTAQGSTGGLSALSTEPTTLVESEDK